MRKNPFRLISGAAEEKPTRAHSVYVPVGLFRCVQCGNQFTTLSPHQAEGQHEILTSDQMRAKITAQLTAQRWAYANQFV